jgi:hypothetical protein
MRLRATSRDWWRHLILARKEEVAGAGDRQLACTQT